MECKPHWADQARLPDDPAPSEPDALADVREWHQFHAMPGTNTWDDFERRMVGYLGRALAEVDRLREQLEATEASVGAAISDGEELQALLVATSARNRTIARKLRERGARINELQRRATEAESSLADARDALEMQGARIAELEALLSKNNA